MTLTIQDLGWTPEYAAYVRGLFMCNWEDWDDPEMDVYDEQEYADIKEGLEDIAAGRVSKFTSVKELLEREEE